MEEKMKELEREISGLEGACIEINVSPDSELHSEINSMDDERRALKDSFI